MATSAKPPPIQVAQDELKATLSLFRNNRGLPAPPTHGDIESIKQRVQTLHGDMLKTAKMNGTSVVQKDREKAAKSFTSAAVVELLDSYPSSAAAAAVTGAAPRGILTAPPAIGDRPSSNTGGGVLAPTGRSDDTSSAPVGIPRSKASDLLSHLTFAKAAKAPDAVWHPKWKLKRVIAGHTGWVRCLDVDVSNEWFVSGGNDRLIKVWDLATGHLKLTLTGHIHNVRGLVVSQRHPYLFSCGEDNTVKCWDLEANKVVRHYHGHLSGVYSLTLHPSVDVLASGGRDAAVRLWDIRTRDMIHCFSGHSSTIFSLASQSIEPQLISGSADNTIRTWDLRAGRCATILTHHSKCIRSLAVHPRLYTFLSAAGDALKIWKGEHAAYERDLAPCKSIINSVAIKDDPESAVVVAGSDSGHLHFWDWRSGKRFQTLETIPQPGSLASENAIFAVKFDQSETRLITGECDKSIKIWEEDADYDDDAQMDDNTSPDNRPPARLKDH